jgi:hypothetical protein
MNEPVTPRRCIHCSDELTKDDPPVSLAANEVSCGANPDGVFHEPERCPECDGYGWVDTFDKSTDAVIGGFACSLLGDPKWHAPAAPVPRQIAVVPGHHPDCDGTCKHTYPDGCPPF